MPRHRLCKIPEHLSCFNRSTRSSDFFPKPKGMNNISILHFSLDLDKKGNYSNIIGQTSGCDKHVLKLCFLLLMMFNFKFDCQDSSWEPVNSKSCLFRVECYSIFLISSPFAPSYTFIFWVLTFDSTHALLSCFFFGS